MICKLVENDGVLQHYCCTLIFVAFVLLEEVWPVKVHDEYVM